MPCPMPNDTIDQRTVVASCWYRDLLDSDTKGADDDWPNQVYLVLLLGKEEPFFTVAHVADKEHGWELWTILQQEHHRNIVPAVATYEEWGGDY